MERKRLDDAREKGIPWKKWGPYLSERQWGTVREDYSEGGDAWNYFTHDQARSRAYRWGEDGLAGISDDRQRLCFALALWNGKDPILKERAFGLSNSEGNHGEDVKDYYFYLDSTPTHSYMKYLYKYPQAAFPYDDLVRTNGKRTREEMEYELLDTGVFEGDRYFDVFVEYAKGGPDDILVKITAVNRGPEAAELHLLPTLWFRNDWSSWIANPGKKPKLGAGRGTRGHERGRGGASPAGGVHAALRGRRPAALHRERDEQRAALPREQEREPVRQGRHQRLRGPRQAGRGEPGEAGHQGRGALPRDDRSRRRRRRCGCASRPRRRPGRAKAKVASPFGDFDRIFAARLEEADEFYRSVTPPSVSPDQANVMRQALAGMLWSKQFYFFDGDQWLKEHHASPLQRGSKQFRNRDWYHMLNEDIISMPDKWEYPWYAAWDLAFHTLPLAIVDPDFAKQQMELMLRGSLPAPQRPDAGLRVELQRREPAGPRLRDALPAPHREGAARTRRTSTSSSRPSTSCSSTSPGG